jgi:hypothetical protein
MLNYQSRSVSTRQMVFLMTGMFSLVGIAVSVIIIASGGGFSGPGPSITKPPTNADLWRLGQKINDGTELNYSLTVIDPVSSFIDAYTSIKFSKDMNDYWKTNFHVINGTLTKDFTILLSKQQLIQKNSAKDEFKQYFKLIENSILSIRDIAREPKYLVIGAPWDTILVGVSSVPVKVIDKENIKTSAGNFEAFVIGYKIGSKTSKIWLTHKVPLPVKAEIYNSEGKLLYKYILVGMKL